VRYNLDGYEGDREGGRDLPLRALFVNENIGGHGALHQYLRAAIEGHPEVAATFFDVPPRSGARRLAGARVPGLDRLDLDLQPLRAQLAQSAAVRRYLLRRLGSYDVLHLYTHNAGLLSTDLLRRAPSVVSLDATDTQNAHNRPRRSTRWTPLTTSATRVVESRVYAAATMVVSHSEWAADSLRDYGVPEERLRIVRFGVPFRDVLTPKVARESGALPEVTFVGGTMTRKGGWELLEVFRRHLRGMCVLNLVTREEVPAEPGVRVFGDFRPGDARLTELLAHSAVFALPTEADASPFAVLEAMAAGLPVVTTRVGGLPEMVEDGVSGVLVDAGDGDALATAISQLLVNEGDRTAMGAAARQRVRERYTLEASTVALLRVLGEAVSRHSEERPQD
jgi:glycosyltransferase involved in cell wall biosynthesis